MLYHNISQQVSQDIVAPQRLGWGLMVCISSVWHELNLDHTSLDLMNSINIATTSNFKSAKYNTTCLVNRKQNKLKKASQNSNSKVLGIQDSCCTVEATARAQNLSCSFIVTASPCSEGTLQFNTGESDLGVSHASER